MLSLDDICKVFSYLSINIWDIANNHENKASIKQDNSSLFISIYLLNMFVTYSYNSFKTSEQKSVITKQMDSSPTASF